MGACNIIFYRTILLSCYLVLFTIALASVPSVLAAEQKMRVAVFEFDVKGDLGIKDAGSIIAESLITSLTQSNAFALKERLLLKKILEEQSLSSTGIINRETAVEIGKLYGVEGIIAGSITKWGNLIQVNARLIGTKDGSVLRGAMIEANNINEIPLLINALATDIANPPETRERTLVDSTPASFSTRRPVTIKEKKETTTSVSSSTQVPSLMPAAADTKKPEPVSAPKVLPAVEPEPEPIITNTQGMTFALIPAIRSERRAETTPSCQEQETKQLQPL
jgi:TolB-like protein